MLRTLLSTLQNDVKRKLVLLTGPRQVGKTTLSKMVSSEFEYLNFDSAKDRKVMRSLEWNREAELVILDEIHKMRRWKSWLKGVYDTEKRPPYFLVTGSARLDVYRKGGDSLAGRHFTYRLHPFTVKETLREVPAKEALHRLMTVGGFPEPFLANDATEANRWRRGHLDVVLRQDLLDLERVREIKSIEILVSLVKERVGSTVSYASLSENLGVSSHTIKHWLEILENLYVIFRVTPYSRGIARSIRKEPKFYLFDTGAVEGDEGARLENVVACALRAELDYLEDTTGITSSLHFLRDKEKREVDFLVVVNRRPIALFEVKLSDDSFSPALFSFRKHLPKEIKSVQIVRNLARRKTKNGVSMVPAHEALAEMETYL